MFNFFKNLSSKTPLVDDEPTSAQAKDADRLGIIRAFAGSLQPACDQIKGAYGEFGFDLTNPIPVNGVTGSIVYLNRLCISRGSGAYPFRITVCLHAGTYGSQAHEHPVALETAQRAIALADWFAEEQLRILNTGRMERKAARLKKLKELIILCYNGTATLRDLDKSNNFKQGEVRELASRFPETLVIEKRVTGGRPSEIVSIIKNEI